ncbi:hypothetical protein Purlil1_12978 [Purpureocillium lilacinum]|uniref:AB hydrolase-1 domain-containing protein n=1 Tax=Purpureocillium lilacinum TaxID=33203 RepID=A0ABR0BFB3_PURLI|nr:hypothetical protein Purlil1_12978 [Purpureocillium lilacinum]
MYSASALPLTLLAGTVAIAFLWWSRHCHTLASGDRAEVLPGRPAQDPQRGPHQGQISQRRPRAGSAVPKRSARQPLEILHPEPTDSKDDVREVDIIAVHGLGSDVDWSWTWKDGDRHVHWLSDHDMLPANVPKARIIAYKYDSRWHSNAPKTCLQLCGEELAHSIHSFRDGFRHQPVVFLGHSLGGLVIQHRVATNDEHCDKDKICGGTIPPALCVRHDKPKRPRIEHKVRPTSGDASSTVTIVHNLLSPPAALLPRIGIKLKTGPKSSLASKRTAGHEQEKGQLRKARRILPRTRS